MTVKAEGLSLHSQLCQFGELLRGVLDVRIDMRVDVAADALREVLTEPGTGAVVTLYLPSV